MYMLHTLRCGIGTTKMCHKRTFLVLLVVLMQKQGRRNFYFLSGIKKSWQHLCTSVVDLSQKITLSLKLALKSLAKSRHV